jgi:formate dehydrogenase major subunit
VTAGAPRTSSELLRLEIDGREIWTPWDRTVLEVALSAGIEIPRLCHAPQLRPNGNCGLCVVEIEGEPAPVRACLASAVAGMVVRTTSPALAAERTRRIEELFADHWADCLAPCRLACPADTDAQGYIALIAQGRHRDAVELIKKTNPFPGVIGRVCTRPCEGACRRSLVEDPIGICFLKRVAADRDRRSPDRYRPEVGPSTGKRVAIVGGGPAGLAAAYYLALDGHAPVVFEALPQAGGMLRYGIPAYRLPKDILDDEIGQILELGVELRTGQRLGRDFTLEYLQAEYDAVFLGLGAQNGSSLGLPELPGVMSGVDFLRAIGLGETIELGKRVVVVGGGNVAIDAARSALRLGAEKVSLVYRRGRAEMPAHHVEIEEAEHEQVELLLLSNPVRLVGTGRLEGVECVRMGLGEPDASGRRRPEPIPGSEFVVPADNLIAAIGQGIDGTGAEPVMKGKYCGADPATMQTALPGVFAAGDAVTGPDAAIRAIAGGRAAARSINQYLRGERIDPGPAKPFSAVKGGIAKGDLAAQPQPREPMPVLVPVGARLGRGNFTEVELGYGAAAALAEARRCLECGCVKQHDCDLRLAGIVHQARPGTDHAAMRHYAPDADHPTILRDQNKCIQCRKCERVCADLVGAFALEYQEAENAVVPTGNVPLRATKCVACGMCVSVCPTAALVENSAPFSREPLWPPLVTQTTCGYCGVGCQVELHTDRKGRVFRVTAPPGEGVNQGSLCAKGRFGYHFINHPDRLRTPLIRRGGQLTPATWEEAIALVAEKFAEIRAAHGPDALAGLSSARCTNEDNYLFQKFFRAVVGTNNVDHCARL